MREKPYKQVVFLFEGGGGAVLSAQTDGKCTAPSCLRRKVKGDFTSERDCSFFTQKKPNEENNERVIGNGCRQGYMEKGKEGKKAREREKEME